MPSLGLLLSGLVGGLFLAACQTPSPEPAPDPPPAPPRPRESPPAPTPGRLTAIDLTALFARQQSNEVLIYDARPNFIAGFGKIPGAINWPANRFETGLPRHEPEIRAARRFGRPVVVYCTDAACPDARHLAEKIAARGHHVSVLEGGFAEWKEAGLPVE